MNNPFSDISAVRENQFFFGYKEQKKNIEGAIQKSQNAKTSTNIAILGSKATGKTSFLNFIKNYCDEKNILCITQVRPRFFQNPFEFYKSI